MTNKLDRPPVVLKHAITVEDLTRAIFGGDHPVEAVAGMADGVDARTVLGRTLRRFLVPPHHRVIKLLYQDGEPLPDGIEYLVERALRHVCPALELDEPPAGARARLRLRFMKGAKGKQFHRNRYPGTNAIIILEGAQEWNFLPTVPGVDAIFDAYDNPAKYCGYRSHRYETDLPTPALLDTINARLADAGESERIETINVEAGDILIFDGHWWHATRHITEEVTHLCIALNGDEINNRDCQMKKAARDLIRPRGKYTALLWPAKDKTAT